jgi:hypothetical protein
MKESDIIRNISIRYKSEGADKVRADLKALGITADQVSKSSDNLATVTETSARRHTSAAAAYERQQRALDVVYRQTQQFEKVQRTLDQAQQQGLATGQRHAELIALAAQKYGISSVAANDNAKKIGLTAHEMKNLGFQINDVGTMLASGSSPFQALATQGGQVYQILSGANGGVGGAVKDLAGRVLGFLGPAGLMAAGFAAVGAAAFGLFSYLKTEAPTAEKVLAEHDRLLRVIKDSYDSVSQSAKFWIDQGKDATRLQLLQQEIDLRQKLVEATAKAIKPTVSMDLFSGDVDVKEKFRPFRDALADLNEGWQKGTPNVRAFVDEVARIALLTPALQKMGVELINSVGDATKFAKAMDQIKESLKLLDGGKPSEAGKKLLGLPGGEAQINGYQQLIEKTKDHIEELNVEASATGLVSDAVLRLKLQHDAERAGKKAGVEVNQKQLDQLKEELALADRRVAQSRVDTQIKFDRETALFSAEDLQIAQRLKDIIPDLGERMKSPEAAAIRYNNQMKAIGDTIRSSGQSFATDFVGNLRQGQGVMDALGHSAQNLSNTLTNSTISNLLSGNIPGAVVSGIGAIISGIFGSNQAQRDADAKAAQEAALRIESYNKRAALAGIDTASRAGELQMFDVTEKEKP